MISRTAEYAVRAMVALQQHGPDTYLRAHQLSELTGIPANYLSKVMHTLVRAGLAGSTRGRHGGFRLARTGGRITAYEIVDPFDLLSAKRRCLLGNAECSDRTACTAHDRWDRIWSGYEDFLRSTTLEQLSSLPPSKTDRRKKAAR